MQWFERLEKARKDSGLSKAELARRVRVSAPTMTDWSRGAVAEISAESLLLLCRELAVSPWWLWWGAGEAPAPSVSSLLRVAEAQARYQPAAATAAELASLLGRCTPGQRARLIDATRQCVAENQEVVLMSRNNSTGEARQ
jgi:transcriptional regulator with XRE-family HTH domain